MGVLHKDRSSRTWRTFPRVACSCTPGAAAETVFWLTAANSFDARGLLSRWKTSSAPRLHGARTGPSLEALRYKSPGEWGRLMGLDRIPEVRTLPAN